METPASFTGTIKRSCNLQSSQDWGGFFFASCCPVWCHFGCAVTTCRVAHLYNLANTKNFVNGISLTQSPDNNNDSSLFSPLFSASFPFRPVLWEPLQPASFSSSPQESRLNSHKVMTALLKLSFVIWRALPDGCFSHCDAVGRKRDFLFLRRQLWQ